MKIESKWVRSVGLLITLVLSGAASATTIGECGVEPAVESGKPTDVLFELDGKSYRELDLPMNAQQALFDARLKHYKEQLSILDSAIFEIEMKRHLAQITIRAEVSL